MRVLDLPPTALDAEAECGQEVDCKYVRKVQILDRITSQALLQTSQALRILLPAWPTSLSRMHHQRIHQLNLPTLQLRTVHGLT